MAQLKINKKEVQSIINQIVAQIHLEDGTPVADCIEKQIPRVPYTEGDGYDPDGNMIFDIWECPRCGTRYEIESSNSNYCPECGQRINWEGVNNG